MGLFILGIVFVLVVFGCVSGVIALFKSINNGRIINATINDVYRNIDDVSNDIYRNYDERLRDQQTMIDDLYKKH